MSNRTSICLAAVLMPALLLGGCTDPNKSKLELQGYLSKQSEMKKYAFTGEADLELGAVPPSGDANPITANLISMFMNGKMEWSGKWSEDPVGLEATLKPSPAATSGPFELPMLIKDNKMYVSFPLISKKDEYFVIDMKGGAQEGKPLVTAEGLKNTTGLTGGLASALIGDLQGKWVKKTSDAFPLPEGKKGAVYSIAITDKNNNDITAVLQKKWPDLVGTLHDKGLLTSGQTEKLKLKKLVVSAPGQITFAVDPDGFIRDETIKLAFTETDPSGTTSNRHLTLHQTYNEINQDIKFEKDVPKAIKPIEDVLKLLGNPKK